MFYCSPTNLISPGLARIMGEGWETARRRDDGNDWVEMRLAGAGVVAARRAGHHATSSATRPGGRRCSGARPAPRGTTAAWCELLPRTRLQPDTPHRFRLQRGAEVTHVRLDSFPTAAWPGCG